MKIVVDNSAYNYAHAQSKGVSSMRKFIANQPFMYYLRLKGTNTIIMNGVFQ